MRLTHCNNGAKNMQDLVKIAITGPESTGKSQLARELASEYKTTWVPEYAREYIDRLDRPYTREDILEIARGQVRNEEIQAGKAVGMLFCDTELIVTKIWSEVRYGSCDPWILDQISRNNYALYLLCNTDLPWEPDPQREHPHLREKLFELYRDELDSRKFPYFVVSGIGRERLQNAIAGIEKSFH
jgi:NadR type nicotinamide-nucleotide adenylyltransferase